MAPNLLGAWLALATAVCWAISPFCFASASRRIGSLPVAVLRVVLATILLVLVLWLRSILHIGHGPALSSIAIVLTIISGIFGLGIGDLMGYEAFLVAGVQRTTLIATLAPVASVICAWIGFGETMGA